MNIATGLISAKKITVILMLFYKFNLKLINNTETENNYLQNESELTAEFDCCCKF